ncbi:geranylgeranyl diphosphate synthase, type II [Caminicella sporogenes DSM 14501]|uniref:Farnesyl diphosphate synthase n=1 Tax=Caminicella sporogenes DSM 14501 TaxID=1121266 RepID=A0A1M6LLF3_9FIRM|nr:farnesyl diphosphate synthase [Caminicella sporogenes]RKD27873.1 farnesyl-diphosphate synthase [Caminicella sporogenes]SHJ72051.1 geranylgeranyl diphosphate synthase, type II [Caminicella sporogenes DSM 14501]
MDFKTLLLSKKSRVDEELKKYFVAKNGFQKTIFEAMAYSINAGGKRLRPVLMIEVCDMLGGKIDDVMPFACAIEMIHTYSLIHDDLPAMDNDDYRRGKLTNHKVFGEGIAILAGDGLLNLAFETMIKKIIDGKIDKDKGIQAMFEIAKAAGVEGMIGGQVVDLESEGKEIDKETLEFIHLKKTTALIEASIKAGAIIGGANEQEYGALSEYGRNIGLAFQIVDDILDVVGDEKKLGKKVGSDFNNDKSTYVSLFGVDKSKKIAKDLINRSINVLEIFGEKADFLRELSRFLEVRDY